MSKSEEQDKRVQDLELTLAHYRALDAKVRARCAYKEFCKHPDRCANTGRCQAEWSCID